MIRRILVIALVLCAAVAACGKKAPPRPLHFVIPQVSDLKAVASVKAITLSWTLPDPKAEAARTRIFRSALQTEAGDCPACPRQFELITELLPVELKPENGLAKFTDYNVKSGFLYSYKLTLCNSAGICGEESNTSETRIHGAI